MNRQPSYAELAWLGQQFDHELMQRGITLCDDDYRTEAFMDFVSQYEQGVDFPSLNLLYADRMIKVGSIVKPNIPGDGEVIDWFNNNQYKVIGAIRPGELIGNGEVNDKGELIYRLESDFDGLFKNILVPASQLQLA